MRARRTARVEMDERLGVSMRCACVWVFPVEVRAARRHGVSLFIESSRYTGVRSADWSRDVLHGRTEGTDRRYRQALPRCALNGALAFMDTRKGGSGSPHQFLTHQRYQMGRTNFVFAFGHV